MALGIFGKSTKSVDNVEESLSTEADVFNIENIENIDFGVGELSGESGLDLSELDNLSADLSEAEDLSGSFDSQSLGEQIDVSPLDEDQTEAPKFEGAGLDAVLDNFSTDGATTINAEAGVFEQEAKMAEDMPLDTFASEEVTEPHFETSVSFDASVIPEASETDDVLEGAVGGKFAIEEAENVFQESSVAYGADNVVAADEEMVSKAVSSGYTVGSGEAPKPELVFGLTMSGDAGYAVWYSGFADTQYFNVTKQTSDMMIQGTDSCKAIHISCGYDAYGWLVQFDNGTAMSLADVREFQLRKGYLPDRGGVIYYGENENVFKDIERIVIYQSTQYFSYGV